MAPIILVQSLAPPGDAVIHWDLTNAAQNNMWQEDTQGTLVSADGHEIGYLADLGSWGVDLIQATAAQTPHYETTDHVVPSGSFLSASSTSLRGTFGAGDALTSGWTIALVWVYDQSATSYIFSVASTELALRVSGTAFNLIANGAIENSHASTISGTDEIRAVWWSVDTDDTTQRSRSNWDGTIFETNAVTLPDTANQTVGIGGLSAASTNFLSGDIFEVLLYNTKWTAAEETQFENYVTAKYGITWT